MYQLKAEKLWKGLALFAVLFCSIPSFADNIQVTGRVQDVTGEVLIGVTVTEKGTNNVAITEMGFEWKEGAN